MEVFVFGSNEVGRHGKGAALHAMKYHGARPGIGEGMSGRSYGIPTKGKDLRFSLSLAKIRDYVERFLRHATEHSYDTFYVTAVGTGLAGFSHEQIAPMFQTAPSNCLFPIEWKQFLVGRHPYQYHEGLCKCTQH